MYHRSEQSEYNTVGDLYNYRAYLETILSYGNDAASSHLTKSYWYKDAGDMLPCDPTKAKSTITGFIERWNKQKQSKEIEMYGRIHSDLCNVPKFLIPGVRLQIKYTKAKPSFYLMNIKYILRLFLNFSTLNCTSTTSKSTRVSYGLTTIL